jgi:signal transduction histidine kinase
LRSKMSHPTEADALFATIVNVVQENVYADEVAPEHIGNNRLAILTPIVAVDKTCVVQIWLYEPDQVAPHMRLSYIAPKQSESDLSLLGVAIQVNAQQQPDHLDPSSRTQLIRKALSLSRTVHPSSELIDFQYLSKRMMEKGGGRTLDALIGVMIITSARSAPQTTSERIISLLIRNRMSAMIEQSRLRRLIHFTEEIDSLVVSEFRNTDEMLWGVTERIQELIGCEHAEVYSTITRHSLRRVSYASEVEARITSRNRELDAILSLGAPARLSAATSKLISGPERPQPRNALAIPVVVNGITLLETQSFVLRADMNHIYRPKRVSQHLIVAFNKLSPHYLGDWFSETDMKQAKIAGDLLGKQIMARSTRRAFREIASFFETFADASPFDLKPYEEFLRRYAPAVNKIHLVDTPATAAMPKAAALRGSNTRERVVALADLHAPERDTLVKRKQPLVVQVAYLANQSIDAGGQLIFFVPTRQFIPRYLAVSLSSGDLAKSEFDFICQFAQEFHLHLRHYENVRERTTTMGNIRHATIGALSSCVAHITILNKAVNRARNSSSGWEALRDDPVITLGLKQAAHLGQQARVLAESARTLVRRLQYKELKYNERFSPLDVYDEIKLAMQIESERKRMTWSLKTNLLRETKVGGERVLMWMAIYNFLDNAVKFGAPHSRINISMNRNGDDTRWHFEVQNSGSFIREEDRPRIFELFYRGDQVDILNQRTGTGIGLPVSKMILEAHSEECDVSCNSEMRGGLDTAKTTFRFELPMRLTRGAQ